MHSQSWRLLAAFVGAATLSFGADRGLLNLVGPDAQMVAGLQVDQAKSSTFGQYLLKQLPVDDPEMNKFIQDAGFDPRRDLREFIVVSGSGADSQFAAVRGTFDLSRITALAKRENVSVTKYQGFDVIQQNDGKWVGFAENTIAILGNSASVKAALGRRQTGAVPAKSLLDQADQLSGVNDFWFIANVPQGTGIAAPGSARAHAPMIALGSLQKASGGVRLGSTMQLNVEATARSEKDAGAMADVVRMLAAMPKEQTDGTPLAGSPVDLSQLQVSTQGAQVRLALPVSEASLEQWVQTMHSPKANAAPARAPRARRVPAR